MLNDRIANPTKVNYYEEIPDGGIQKLSKFDVAVVVASILEDCPPGTFVDEKGNLLSPEDIQTVINESFDEGDTT